MITFGDNIVMFTFAYLSVLGGFMLGRLFFKCFLGLFVVGVVCMARVFERCKNPWSNRCKNSDVVLYILYKGEEVPICSRCWRKIAGMDVEW